MEVWKRLRFAYLGLPREYSEQAGAMDILAMRLFYAGALNPERAEIPASERMIQAVCRTRPPSECGCGRSSLFPWAWR